MNVIELMPNIGVRFLPARLWSVILSLCVVNLTGCSAPMVVTSRIPEPAADLMQPAPTGSEVLQRATGNMQTWLQMLQSGQTP
ncbi:hypothetical protein [Castellaniella sp. S9]|uniref:hypothetical protein n=1 Tax=Castellaniella sp. S9 TaxID=2993652 RepID=UPI0022B447B9|nr:hypothetical protein [Castellaniella sp. S9]